jgi:hypothetical protein
MSATMSSVPVRLKLIRRKHEKEFFFLASQNEEESMAEHKLCFHLRLNHKNQHNYASSRRDGQLNTSRQLIKTQNMNLMMKF